MVHNGIIENYQELKAELINRGYQFASQTDTEVIAHLVNWEQRQGGTLREVVQRVILNYVVLTVLSLWIVVHQSY